MSSHQKFDTIPVGVSMGFFLDCKQLGWKKLLPVCNVCKSKVVISCDATWWHTCTSPEVSCLKQNSNVFKLSWWPVYELVEASVCLHRMDTWFFLNFHSKLPLNLISLCRQMRHQIWNLKGQISRWQPMNLPRFHSLTVSNLTQIWLYLMEAGERTRCSEGMTGCKLFAAPFWS